MSCIIRCGKPSISCQLCFSTHASVTNCRAGRRRDEDPGVGRAGRQLREIERTSAWESNSATNVSAFRFVLLRARRQQLDQIDALFRAQVSDVQFPPQLDGLDAFRPGCWKRRGAARRSAFKKRNRALSQFKGRVSCVRVPAGGTLEALQGCRRCSLAFVILVIVVASPALTCYSTCVTASSFPLGSLKRKRRPFGNRC